jgi:hypothetical protein
VGEGTGSSAILAWLHSQSLVLEDERIKKLLGENNTRVILCLITDEIFEDEILF